MKFENILSSQELKTNEKESLMKTRWLMIYAS